MALFAAWSTAASMLLPTPAFSVPSPGAQIEEEDLPTAADVSAAAAHRELLDRFAEAEEIFLSADQPRSVALFSEILDALESLPEEERGGGDLEALCLYYRAQASFNLGEDDRAEEDLQRLIRLSPGFTMDPELVSPKLVQLFESLQRRILGRIDVVVHPADAEVTLDGEPVEPSAGPLPLLEGTYVLAARRPGYDSTEGELAVTVGKTHRVELTLERSSAVLRLRTRPGGATVLLDGEKVGTTEGTAPEDWYPDAEDAPYPRDEYSAELVVGGIAPGEYDLAVRKDGYRPRRFSWVVGEIADYYVGAIALEDAVGFLLLEDFPSGASVAVDGVVTEPQRTPEGLAELSLAPGEHRIHVSHATAGIFEAELSLEDKQIRRLAVRLRPGVSFLGVLGADEISAGRVEERVLGVLSRLEDWAFLDRSDAGPLLLATLGVNAGTMRTLAASQAAPSAGLDWRALQQGLDREVPGAVYLLAVLSDDLLATHADFWIVPGGPAPALADRQRVALAEPGELETVLSAFAEEFNPRRPWVGVLLIDSLAASGPLVAAVTPDGPAAKAGLAVGEEIVSVAAKAVSDAARATALLSELEPSSEVPLLVRGRAGERTVRLRLGSSPEVVAFNEPGRIYAVLAAQVASSLARPDPGAPRWVLELNQAAVLLHGRAWEEAVRLLRGIQAPSQPGLGQSAVDYWSGVALGAAGPAYREAARSAFERAAALPGARLEHHDGPLVAPLARAHLAAFDTASQ